MSMIKELAQNYEKYRKMNKDEHAKVTLDNLLITEEVLNVISDYDFDNVVLGKLDVIMRNSLGSCSSIFDHYVSPEHDFASCIKVHVWTIEHNEGVRVECEILTPNEVNPLLIRVRVTNVTAY